MFDSNLELETKALASRIHFHKLPLCSGIMWKRLKCISISTNGIIIREKQAIQYSLEIIVKLEMNFIRTLVAEVFLYQDWRNHLGFITGEE